VESETTYKKTIQVLYRKFLNKFENQHPELNFWYLIDRDLTLNEKVKYGTFEKHGMKFHKITNDEEWKQRDISRNFEF